MNNDHQLQAAIPDRRREDGDWRVRRRRPSRIPPLTTSVLSLVTTEAEAVRLEALGIHARYAEQIARAAHVLQHFDPANILIVKALGGDVVRLAQRHSPRTIIIESTERISSQHEAAMIAGGRMAVAA